MSSSATPSPRRRAGSVLHAPAFRRAVWCVLGAATLLGLHLNQVESSEAAVDLNRRVRAGGGAAHVVVELVSEGGLVLLAVVVLGVALQARRAGARALATVLSASAGTAVALVCSEALKALHAQERPCHGLAAVEPLVACPPPGDWSLPSNHAVLAGAAATVVVLAAPRWWRLVVPVALLVAASRVAAGVHYPHDVVDGLSLGVVVVLLTVLVGRRPVERVVLHLGASRRRGPWLA